jgi:hypothetical protein
VLSQLGHSAPNQDSGGRATDMRGAGAPGGQAFIKARTWAAALAASAVRS